MFRPSKIRFPCSEPVQRAFVTVFIPAVINLQLELKKFTEAEKPFSYTRHMIFRLGLT